MDTQNKEVNNHSNEYHNTKLETIISIISYIVFVLPLIFIFVSINWTYPEPIPKFISQIVSSQEELIDLKDKILEGLVLVAFTYAAIMMLVLCKNDVGSF